MASRARNMAMIVMGIGVLAVGLVRAAPVAGQDEADRQAQIDSAMSAAPSSVSANATILANERDETGEFIVLQEGSNGWYCQPDEPETPGPDPMCFDQTWLDWMNARAAGEEPKVTEPGFAYMLQGGSEASNSDPAASEPAAGDEWMTSPPHIMLLLPGGPGQSGLSSDFAAGGPWIMFEGTSSEHIMMPVAEGVMGEMGEMAEATPTG